MPIINQHLMDYARAVLDDSVDGIVAERDAHNAICDLFRSQQEEIDRLKKELAEETAKRELELQIESVEQLSNHFTVANAQMIKLWKAGKITHEEGLKILKEKFPHMMTDDDDEDDD